MSDFEEFMECLSEATKELVENVEEAWDELKVDLREVVTVKYLRPGGVAYCKAEGKKYYGILTGTQIISLNKDMMRIPAIRSLLPTRGNSTIRRPSCIRVTNASGNTTPA